MKLNLQGGLALVLSHNKLRNLFIGITIAVVVCCFLFLGLPYDSLLPLTALLLIILSLFAVFQSSKTWIPVLICLLLVRDFNLASLVGGAGLKIGDIFIVIVFSILLLNDYFQNASNMLLKSKLDLAIVVFILFNILSLFWSTDLAFGFVRVFKLARNFCFYMIIRDLFMKDFEGSYKKATASFIVTGTILLVVYMGIILSSGGFSDFLALYKKNYLSSVDLGALRMRGTGGGFLISGPSDWFTTTMIFVYGSFMLAKSKLQKILKIIVVLVFILATVITLSRSAIIVMGLILMTLSWGNLKLKLRENAFSLITILIVLATLGTAFGITKICFKRFVHATKDGSWTERIDYYKAATDAFAYSPVFGIGAGSNFSWQSKYPLEQSRIVHSLPLLVLSEVGILGFAIFAVMIWLWLKYLWICMHYCQANNYFQGISLAMFAFSVSYLVHSLTVGEFESFEPWLVMGVTSAMMNLNKLSKGSFKEISLKNKL